MSEAVECALEYKDVSVLVCLLEQLAGGPPQVRE